MGNKTASVGVLVAYLFTVFQRDERIRYPGHVIDETTMEDIENVAARHLLLSSLLRASACRMT